MRIEYHPAIEGELRQIVQFYNQSVEGLGTEFLSQFDQQILKIAENPLLWIELEKGVHRALMQRFPFVVYYRIFDDRIRGLVVKHQRRHPRLGLLRR